MSNLEKFQDSNAWSKSYGLPLCPDLNNPWIYTAYAQKILKTLGETLDQTKIESYGELCQERRGLYNRWPTGFGGLTSPDEIVGMAYLSQTMARLILDYLYMNDGVYNNTGEMALVGDERFDMKRFVYLIPFLRSRSDMYLSPSSKLFFAGHVIANSFSKNYGSKLLVDVMREEMSKHFICKLAYKFWDMRQEMMGFTKKKCLQEELKSYPIYADLSQEWS